MHVQRLLFPLMLLVAPLVQADTNQAQALLRAMAEAYHGLEYQGRFIYAHGGDISTMEVSHAVIDGREYERLTHLDGQLTELIRNDDEVICIHPDQTMTRLPAGSSLGPLGVRERLSRVPEQYNVLLDGEGRVAGRQALRLRLAPLDNHRHGYRLWIDRESSLLLKSEMVDDDGRALERIEFVALNLNPQLVVDDFAAPRVVSERILANVEQAPGPQADLDLKAGWLPNGFAAAGRDLRQPNGESAPVVAKTYSDGLAAFSIFIENLAAGGDREAGVSRLGPTVAVTRYLEHAGSEYRLTLIGEVPLDTAERVASAVVLEGVTDD